MGGFPASIEELAGYPSLDKPPDDILRQRLAEQNSQMQTGGQIDVNAMIQQHQAKSADLASQAQQVEVKQGDLDLANRMVKLLDPTVPKPARAFLYKEMSRQMGVDPKGETSKEVGQMLLSLDPESMDHLRRAIADRVPTAKPGEINELIKGVLTGKVGGMELLKLAGPQPAKEDSSTGAATKRPDVPVGSEPIRRRIQGPGDVPPIYQPTDPQLVKVLGLDPTTKYRNEDLIKHGYTIPIDAKQQREMAEKILEQSGATLTTTIEAARMYQLFKGKPEVLGLVGGAARTADQIVDQARGLVRTVGKPFGLDINDEVDIKDKTTQSLARRAADKISGFYKGAGIEQTAVDSGRLNSAMISMAYSMATARGIPGNRLTNAIINQHLGELGSSQSVAQFEASLKDTLQRAVERTQNEINTKLGKPDNPPVVSNLNDAQIRLLRDNHEVLPIGLKKAVLEDIERRTAGKAPGAGSSIARNSPTIEEEERLQAADQARKENREGLAEDRARQELALKELREARQDRAEGRAEHRADRAEIEAQRRYELALRRERRMEEQHRRDKISAAFLALGKSLAGSSGSVAGISGGGGEGQSAEAFRISQPARRAPPQPIDASRFQRQAK